MRSLSVSFLAVLALLGGGCCSSELIGTVSHYETHEPIRGAEVSIDGIPRRARSGHDGRYRIRSIPCPKRYMVRVIAPGYPERWHEIYLRGGRTTYDFTLGLSMDQEAPRDYEPVRRQEPEPEPQPRYDPEPEPEPQPRYDPEPQPEPEPQPRYDPEPEPEPEPRVDPEPAPEPQPRPQPATRPCPACDMPVPKGEDFCPSCNQRLYDN